MVDLPFAGLGFAVEGLQPVVEVGVAGAQVPEHSRINRIKISRISIYEKNSPLISFLLNITNS